MRADRRTGGTCGHVRAALYDSSGPFGPSPLPPARLLTRHKACESASRARNLQSSTHRIRWQQVSYRQPKLSPALLPCAGGSLGAEQSPLRGQSSLPGQATLTGQTSLTGQSPLQSSALPSSRGSGPRIYVGGIPTAVSETMIRQHFSQWGQVGSPLHLFWPLLCPPALLPTSECVHSARGKRFTLRYVSALVVLRCTVIWQYSDLPVACAGDRLLLPQGQVP